MARRRTSGIRVNEATLRAPASPILHRGSDLLLEIKQTREELLSADRERIAKLQSKADKSEIGRLSNEMAACAGLQTAVNSLSAKIGLPGGGLLDAGAQSIRDSARGLLEVKHFARIPKAAPDKPAFNPSEPEIEEAEHAVRGLRHLFKCTSLDQLPLIERKALTSFNMGASGFILAPEMSDKILSCLVDLTDLTGMVGNINISAGSIKFMVDNVRLMNAGWACDNSCYANNPPGSFTEGRSPAGVADLDAARRMQKAGRLPLPSPTRIASDILFRNAQLTFWNIHCSTLTALSSRMSFDAQTNKTQAFGLNFHLAQRGNVTCVNAARLLRVK